MHCIRCDTDKPDAEFPGYNLKPGNHHWCRVCQRAYDREYARRKPGKMRAKEARYRAGNPDAIAAGKRAYRERHRAHKAASDAVYRALLSGALTKPNQCETRGCTREPQAHHWSYLPEHRLDVEWLCRPCHSGGHRIRGDYEPQPGDRRLRKHL